MEKNPSADRILSKVAAGRVFIAHFSKSHSPHLQLGLTNGFQPKFLYTYSPSPATA